MFARANLLLTEVPPIIFKPTRNPILANNHILGAHYAMCLDSLPISDLGKSHIQFLHRTLCHTSKHILHKYKRISSPTIRYQVHAVVNYTKRESIWVKYSEYPLIIDLKALKHELSMLTLLPMIKIDGIDRILTDICEHAFDQRKHTTYADYQELSKQVESYWELLIDFIIKQRKREIA